MITSLGSPWSSADITANGTFVQILTGTEFPKTYIVSNCIATNLFQILRTINGGQTFEVVASGLAGPGFDPVVYLKGTSLYFIGAITNTADATKTDLVIYTYNTTDDNPTTPATLTPYTLVTANRIHSGYDFVCLADGSFIVVTSVTQPTTPSIADAYALIALHVSSAFVVGTVDTLVAASSIRAGEAYGGISMMLTGNLIELFYSAHQKKVTFGPIRQEIRYRSYNTASPGWSGETLLKGFSSQYIDDKLTVVPLNAATPFHAGDLVLTSLYYVQEKTKLFSVMQVASRISGVWKWVSYPGSTNWSFLEPTLTVSENNDVALVYTQGDINTGGGGNLRVVALNPTTLQYTQQAGSWNKFNFRWLRGSKNPVAASDLWVVIGEHTKKTITPVIGLTGPTGGTGSTGTTGVIGYTGATEYTPFYVSHLNLPPTVVVSPSTATIERDTLLRLSAAGTIDPDYDTLQFTWSKTGGGNQVHLIPVLGAPSKMDVLVDKSIGPNPVTFTVSVSVVDLDPYGAPIHSPVIATSTLSVPLNHAPVITWSSSSMNVTRNSIIVLEPTIIDAEADNLTYAWTQTSGPTLAVLGPLDFPYLVIRTHGVDVFGATVVFTVRVSDGINDPVVSTVTLAIPAINLSNLDQRFISRTIYFSNGSPILERNNPDGLSEWAALEVGGVSSDFFRSKYTRDKDGHKRQLYVSERTCVVLGEEKGGIYFRKVFLPGNDRGLITDAILAETDDIIVLNDDDKLLRYSSADTGVLNMRDDYQGYADLKPYMGEGKVRWFVSSPLVSGSRVLAFNTSKGVLLVQVRENDFKPQAVVFLSMFDLSLYGGDDVLFIRFKGVESLRKGQILIGTKAPKEALLSLGNTIEVNGFEYFETIFDLSNRSIVDVWDRTNRINERVFTGEFLVVEEALYTGLLQAPVLHLSAIDDTTGRLSWDMIRPDLVSLYTVYFEKLAGIPGNSVRVPPVINGFKGIPNSIDYGETVTFKWDVDNANEIKVDGVSYPIGTNKVTVIPKTSGTHVLTARNAWGISEKETAVTVLPAPPTISSFTVNGGSTVSIPYTSAVQFAWNVTGADTIYIDQGVGEVTGRSGKSTLPPASAVYTLFAINSFGSSSATVAVTTV